MKTFSKRVVWSSVIAVLAAASAVCVLFLRQDVRVVQFSLSTTSPPVGERRISLLVTNCSFQTVTIEEIHAGIEGNQGLGFAGLQSIETGSFARPIPPRQGAVVPLTLPDVTNRYGIWVMWSARGAHPLRHLVSRVPRAWFSTRMKILASRYGLFTDQTMVVWRSPWIDRTNGLSSIHTEAAN